MPCSGLQPACNFGVAGFVSGGAGAAERGCRGGYGRQQAASTLTDPRQLDLPEEIIDAGHLTLVSLNWPSMHWRLARL